MELLQHEIPTVPARWAPLSEPAAIIEPHAPPEISRSVGQFVEQVQRSQVLEPGQCQELLCNEFRFQDPCRLADHLVGKGWLTRFQADHLLEGHHEKLHVGPYVLVDKIGEGGMSTVWKARHRLMKRTVALKVIRKGHLEEEVAIQRFHREIELAAQLSHPHIVIAHDAGQAEGLHYLVMEFIEGENLAAVIRKHGQLPVPLACEIVRQTALGLQHLHELGLVHRDIKPGNLLLCGTGADAMVKILDLGISRLHYETIGKADSLLTRLGTALGTPDYMAPEQIVDTHQVTIRADIYSLGCTFFHMLIGRPPFAEGTDEQKLAWHFERTPPAVDSLRPETGAELAAIVQTMLAKNPRDRYRTPALVTAALEPFCPGTQGRPEEVCSKPDDAAMEPETPGVIAEEPLKSPEDSAAVNVLPLFDLDVSLPSDAPPPARPAIALVILRWLCRRTFIGAGLLFVCFAAVLFQFGHGLGGWLHLVLILFWASGALVYYCA